MTTLTPNQWYGWDAALTVTVTNSTPSTWPTGARRYTLHADGEVVGFLASREGSTWSRSREWAYSTETDPARQSGFSHYGSASRHDAALALLQAAGLA